MICIGCGKCTRVCAHGACAVVRGKVKIDPKACVGCGRCIGARNRDAIESDFGTPCTVMQGKIAEYAAAVVRGKPAFHLSFVTEVSPHCDCHGMNDVPIVANVGMLASADPVAIDQAAADLVNAAPALSGSVLEGLPPGEDKFTAMHPTTRWREAIAEAERMKLGSSDYVLRRI